MTTTTETLREACPYCDRAECHRDPPMPDEVKEALKSTMAWHGRATDEQRATIRAWTDKIRGLDRECSEHAVDWRAVALGYRAGDLALHRDRLRAKDVEIAGLRMLLEKAHAQLEARTLTTEAAAGTGGEPTDEPEWVTMGPVIAVRVEYVCVQTGQALDLSHTYDSGAMHEAAHDFAQRINARECCTLKRIVHVRTVEEEWAIPAESTPPHAEAGRVRP